MIQAINHICFSVADLATSIDFYERILQGDLLVQGDSIFLYTYCLFY